MIDELKASKPVLLVTFIYDTLLDLALGRELGQANDYIDERGFSLIKPHGSVDWVQIVTGVRLRSGSSSLTESDLIESAEQLEFGEVVHERQMARWSPLNPAVQPFTVPALAIPIAQKANFVCPRAMLDRLRESLGKVTSIVIIGWRGGEAHFMELLREYLSAPVRVVAACGPLEEAEQSPSGERHPWRFRSF